MKNDKRAKRGSPRDAALAPAPMSKGRYEQLYKMLVEASPFSVLLIDRNLRIVSSNRNFLEKARRSDRSTIGRHITEVFPPVILSEMKLGDRIGKVLQANEPVKGERMAYRAPGVPLRIYYYSIVPVTWNGKTETVLLLMEDVTEQTRLSEDVRRVERHLASVVESASDFVVSTDPKGRIISWNSAIEKATGYCLEETQSHFFFEHFAPCHEVEVKEVFANIEKLKSMVHSEWNLKNKHGQDLQVSWLCSPMKNQAGEMEGVVAVGRDLTEHRKLEAQIARSQKLAALGVMAGGIAHEIRNPLAVASSAAQFLLEDGEEMTTELRKECAQKVYDGIRRASVIVEHLLRFARSPAPHRETTPVDLVAVARDTLQLLRNEAKLRKVLIIEDLPTTPLRVNGLENMLQQLLMNLLLNAFDAMPSGGKVQVLANREGDFALLKIADTGCGIPHDRLDKIFDPFYTTSPVGKGIGLGLSLCYSIVKQHFGAIEVESSQGVGTTFTIRFPLS